MPVTVTVHDCGTCHCLGTRLFTAFWEAVAGECVPELEAEYAPRQQPFGARRPGPCMWEAASESRVALQCDRT